MPMCSKNLETSELQDAYDDLHDEFSKLVKEVKLLRKKKSTLLKEDLSLKNSHKVIVCQESTKSNTLSSVSQQCDNCENGFWKKIDLQMPYKNLQKD